MHERKQYNKHCDDSRRLKLWIKHRHYCTGVWGLVEKFCTLVHIVIQVKVLCITVETKYWFLSCTGQWATNWWEAASVVYEEFITNRSLYNQGIRRVKKRSEKCITLQDEYTENDSKSLHVFRSVHWLSHTTLFYQPISSMTQLTPLPTNVCYTQAHTWHICARNVTQ